jgi:hypothetical protein
VHLNKALPEIRGLRLRDELSGDRYELVLNVINLDKHASPPDRKWALFENLDSALITVNPNPIANVDKVKHVFIEVGNQWNIQHRSRYRRA